MKHRIVDSPLGPLTLVVTDDGALAALYMADQRHGPAPDADLGESDDTAAADAVEQLHEYFDGTRTTFDLRVEPAGTDFQRQVWEELRRIPRGETRSYAEIAAAIGRPAAMRAVGNACANNPVAIAIPCHRVLRNDGKLGGYAWGSERKQALIAAEQGAAGAAAGRARKKA